ATRTELRPGCLRLALPHPPRVSAYARPGARAAAPGFRQVRPRPGAGAGPGALRPCPEDHTPPRVERRWAGRVPHAPLRPGGVARRAARPRGVLGDRPLRDLRRNDRAAEPLRPVAARHHGWTPAARLRFGCRLYLHPWYRRPGPRHVFRHSLRIADLARCRRW